MISHFDPIVALNLIVRSSLLRATHLLIMFCLFYQICFKSFFLFMTERLQKVVKKAKENWIGAQCEEIATCLNPTTARDHISW